jgi:hypothetical protein
MTMHNNNSRSAAEGQKKAVKFADIYPEICPVRETVIERKIRNSANFAKMLLFMHFKLKHSNPSPSTTVKEVCSELDIGYVQARVMIGDMANLGLLTKHKVSYRNVAWIPTKEVEYYVKLAYKVVTGKEMAKA